MAPLETLKLKTMPLALFGPRFLATVVKVAVLPTCTGSGAWVNVVIDMSAGNAPALTVRAIVLGKL